MCPTFILQNTQICFRMSKSLYNKPDIYKRYTWLLCQCVVHIFFMMGYAMFGSAFVIVPQDFQWILALLSPFVRDLFFKLLLKVAHKAGGKESKNFKEIKFLVLHFVTTNHPVFCAVIVGSVSTPATSACIIAVDFFKALQSGWKIFKKYKNNSNVEGKI